MTTNCNAGIGNNGAVLISKVEGTWGITPKEGMIKALEALSCSLNLNKEFTQSSALNRTRAPRTTVDTNTSRTGSMPLEVKPESGFEELLRTALYYYNTGTAVGAGLTTDLDGAVSAGDTSITLTSGVGVQVNDIIQLGSSTISECVKVTDISASPTFEIERGLLFDHADAEAAVEVEAPFNHEFLFNTDSCLNSLTVDKYNGTLFGTRFKGTKIGQISIESARDEMVTSNLELEAKKAERIVADKSTVIVDSGTTDGTTANKLVESGQNFLTTVDVGDMVNNTTDGTFAYVTAVDSDTQLSIDNDIMVSGEDYVIYSSPYMLTATEIDAITSNVDEPFTFQNGTIKENATDLDIVTSVNLSVNNGLEGGKGLNSGDDLARLIGLQGEINFSFDFEYSDSSIFDKYLAGTKLDILLTFAHDTTIPGTSDTYELSIDLPQVKLTAAPDELSEGVLSSSLEGMAEYSSSDNYNFKITSKNGTYRH